MPEERPELPQMVRPNGVDSPSCWRGTVAMENSQPGPAVSGVVVSTSQVRRLAAAAYLARFRGQSCIHTESDLRGYLNWCESHDLDPLAATRPHIELYVSWLQEVRRYPSTVSRRMSVVAGFYRTCVIDAVLEHSPAEYVRRPNVPAGTDPPPVRGAAYHRQTLGEPLRLRARHHARTAGAPHLRGHRQ